MLQGLLLLPRVLFQYFEAECYLLCVAAVAADSSEIQVELLLQGPFDTTATVAAAAVAVAVPQ